MGEAKRRGPYELRVRQGKVKRVMRIALRELQRSPGWKELNLEQRREAIRLRTEQLLKANPEVLG